MASYSTTDPSPSSDSNTTEKVLKSDTEWKSILTPEEFAVLRNAHTERPGSTSKYYKIYPEKGIFACKACGNELYTAKTKFDSGCGWPAFYDSIPGAVRRKVDNSGGMSRMEILCNRCDGHLGHVFKGENFGNPIDERHCVNSISLTLKEDNEAPVGN